MVISLLSVKLTDNITSMADESFQEFPAYVERSSGKSKILLVLIVLIVIVLVILIALYLLGVSSKKSVSSVVPSPTQQPTPTVTVAPSAEPSVVPSRNVTPAPSRKPSPTSSATTVDRSKLSIAVLNGSGTPGAARTISSSLNDLGYTIQTIGNADSFTYNNITVIIKKSKSNFLPVLKKDIANSSPDIPITTSTDDSISTDAQVIVGK